MWADLTVSTSTAVLQELESTGIYDPGGPCLPGSLVGNKQTRAILQDEDVAIDKVKNKNKKQQQNNDTTKPTTLHWLAPPSCPLILLPRFVNFIFTKFASS